MHANEDAPQDTPRGAPDDASAQAAPGIEETLRGLRDEGREGLKAAADAAKALRILVAADVSLARSAFGRTLAFTGIAIAFGASAWLLLMAALVAALVAAGLSWLVGLLVAAALSVVATAAAGFGAMRYFEHTRLKATRRQLARLGVGELADFMPDAGGAQSSEAAAKKVAEVEAQTGTPPKKGLGIDVTPP
ncbi:phage holin family protein [Thermomonas fusca]|uniref:phage holin family protein n=1 Tax=Thermomonas fusca TaxID=215690 RepID=UPI001BB17610|nr:phage holin family protein [Thermomonas fusca]